MLLEDSFGIPSLVSRTTWSLLVVAPPSKFFVFGSLPICSVGPSVGEVSPVFGQLPKKLLELSDLAFCCSG